MLLYLILVTISHCTELLNRIIAVGRNDLLLWSKNRETQALKMVSAIILSVQH